MISDERIKEIETAQDVKTIIEGCDELLAERKQLVAIVEAASDYIEQLEKIDATGASKAIAREFYVTSMRRYEEG